MMHPMRPVQPQSWRIARAQDSDLLALNAILQLCGEHMYRTEGLTHWYPYRTGEQFRARINLDFLYAVYEGDYLVGTFNLNPDAREYYAQVAWANPNHRALYFGGFGILPAWQGRGMGAWVMAQVDALVASLGYDTLRFDGVMTNASLMRWYDKLAYERRDLVMFSEDYGVQCFERVLV